MIERFHLLYILTRNSVGAVNLLGCGGTMRQQRKIIVETQTSQRHVAEVSGSRVLASQHAGQTSAAPKRLIAPRRQQGTVHEPLGPSRKLRGSVWRPRGGAMNPDCSSSAFTGKPITH